MKTVRHIAAFLLIPTFLSALFLSSCAGRRLSGVFVEEAEYPYSCRIDGKTLVWLFCGEEEYRGGFALRKEGPHDYHPGLFRIVTPEMPFPDPCDDMLFWDADNDCLLLSLFSSDGVAHESRLVRGREG